MPDNRRLSAQKLAPSFLSDVAVRAVFDNVGREAA